MRSLLQRGRDELLGAMSPTPQVLQRGEILDVSLDRRAEVGRSDADERRIVAGLRPRGGRRRREPQPPASFDPLGINGFV